MCALLKVLCIFAGMVSLFLRINSTSTSSVTDSTSSVTDSTSSVTDGRRNSPLECFTSEVIEVAGLRCEIAVYAYLSVLCEKHTATRNLDYGLQSFEIYCRVTPILSANACLLAIPFSFSINRIASEMLKFEILFWS